MIAAFAEPLTQVAFQFGPREYFSLMVLGLVGAVVLASGSLLKAVGMILIGILLGCVGMDVNSGALRYVFGIDELMALTSSRSRWASTVLLKSSAIWMC